MSKCTIKSITRGATNPNEAKDCTVRALANATGISYKDAHALLKKVGRKEKEGASLPVVLNAFEDLAIKPVYIALILKIVGTCVGTMVGLTLTKECPLVRL